MIDYSRFFKYIKKRGLSQYKLQKEYNIPKNLMTRMKHNLPMDSTTLDKICNTLGCRPEDVFEQITDDNKFPPP